MLRDPACGMATGKNSIRNMFKVEQSLRLSATDLVGHLNCRHLTRLDWQAANDLLVRPVFRDPYLEVLWERGAMHERSYVEHLAATGRQVIRIGGVGVTPELMEQTPAPSPSRRARSISQRVDVGCSLCCGGVRQDPCPGTEHCTVMNSRKETTQWPR
jgi:hypothetical protein